MGHHQTAGNTPALGRCTVALVLVVLAQEDVIEAKKMFEQWGSTCDSEEVSCISYTWIILSTLYFINDSYG